MAGWVCVLRIEYTDRSSEWRVLRRGTETECTDAAVALPASTREIWKDGKLLPREEWPEAVEITHPAGKVPAGALAVVALESDLREVMAVQDDG